MVRYYLLDIEECTLLTIGTHLPKTVIRKEDIPVWIEQLSCKGEITDQSETHIIFRVEFEQVGYMIKYKKG